MLKWLDMASIITSPLLKTYTLEEFWELPEPPGREKLELIGGALYMVPPPDGPHNETCAKLNRELTIYLAERGDEGRLYVPRTALWTGPATYVEPDLMYISAPRLATMSPSHLSSADLVVEVISPGSAIYDRNTKAQTYQAMGVDELWLIDPDSRTLESVGWPQDQSGEAVRQLFGQEETLRSELFPGFQPALRTILP